jgi:predicted DsbA family dithiol-disulfide isomerase
MTRPMKIDFVSDVSCPWCIIGLKGLEEALARVGDLVDAEIRFQPFELNPQMPAEGQDLVEHVAQKYGSTREQYLERREMIRARAAELGFTIGAGSAAGRVWNTFDAHRLLHWAGLEGRQRELKLALFEAYFTHGRNPGDFDVLRDAAGKAGLDPDKAGEVLSSGLYGDEVRAAERHWQTRGISGVPAIIIDDRYLISGGQPAEAFEAALRQIATEAPAEAHGAA